MNISEFSVKKPITTLMILLSIIVLGLIGLQRLPLTFFPEFGSRSLTISIPYQSSSPQEVEQLIARPVEEIMGTLSNLETMKSTSSANSCTISLEFKAGTDMDLAAVEVRDRIDRVRSKLPDDVERIRIRRWQTSDMPVFQFSMSWDRSPDELYVLIDKVIIPRIQRIDGVANVEVSGMDDRKVLVDLDMERMRAHGVDFFQLAQSLRNNNINFPGGTVIDGERKYTVRTIGEFRSIEEIAQVPIRGTNLVLADVAEVKYAFPEKKNFQRLNRKQSVVLRVYKSSTANVIEVAGKTRELLDELIQQPEYAGLNVQTIRDQSRGILVSLNSLAMAGIFGALLANVVLFFFLRKFRSTVIIGMAIPIAIIATFLLMYILRLAPFNSSVTLNLVSLSGLMFAVGMLVDPAVVVLENIFRHKQEEGLDARQAAIVGSREITVAVTSATLTTAIVFVPMVFMSTGGMGRWMTDFGIAIVTASVGSLLISLTLIPLAASRLFSGEEKPQAKIILRMSTGYSKAITKLVRFPWSLAGLAVGAFLLWGTFQLSKLIDRAWIPSTPERRMDLRLNLARSFSLADIHSVVDSLESVLFRERETLEISNIATNYRKGRANVTLYFVPEEEGRRTTIELHEEVKKRLPEFAGVEYKVGRMHGRGGNQMGVSIELKGKSTAVLVTFAEEIRTLLSEVPGIKDVDTSMERGDEEVQISVDRTRAQKYGLSTRQVAMTVSSALSSRANSKFKTRDQEIDILVQLAEEDRVNIQQLQNMTVANTEADMVQLGSVADLKLRKGPEAIVREDRQGTVTVFANTGQSGLWSISRKISKIMEDVQLPPGYSWSMGRNWRMMRQGESESMFAIVLAIILIYIVMASLFESFIHPLTIMLSVPFALIGVWFLFWATGTNLTTMGWLGIIVVCGLVVNNGIILIDAINTRRRAGLSRTEAIRIGGRNRLRPILMTTLTTIIGLAPLVVPAMFPSLFGPQEGRAAMYAPVGIAVVGGLLTSTPLTLFLMPIIYVYLDDFVLWMKRIASRTRALMLQESA